VHDLAGMAAATAAAAITSGTAILLATLGEIVAERAGVINLGVEGMMLVGALAGFATAHGTGSPWLGLLAAMAAGGALALVHAVLAVTLRVNQVVSGLALTILGTGVSGFYGRALVGLPAAGFEPLPVPFLADIPFVGRALFSHDPVVYLSFALVPAAAFFLSGTRPGLSLRAVGENPGAADAGGVPVARVRYLATVAGGVLAGAGGAYLSLAHTRMWVQNLTAGQGWIAVALVIFALWHPVRAALGAYLFGGITALQLRLQAVGAVVPLQVLLMLPYLLTIAVLVVISVRGRRTGAVEAPAALGLPWFREDR
jgi:simple sugar transport system permease protein